MGAQASKDELLYQQVNYGNVQGIERLRGEGAGLEFIDKEGKTPLIVACMRPDLLPIAKALIDLGANVNAYRPGCYAGTPLHHAAKRGLEQTVNLLLSHGANPLVMNDDCHTPLDLARAKGHTNVVRVIEAAQPRTVVALWKVKIEEPNFSQPEPSLVIVDNNARTRLKFLAAQQGDKQQLLWFYNACRGMRQANVPHPETPAGAQVPPLLPNAVISTTAASAPTVSEDMELAMAINASIQSAMAEGISPLSAVQPLPQVDSTNGRASQDVPSSSSKTNNGWAYEPTNDAYNGWAVLEPGPSTKSSLVHDSQNNTPIVNPSSQDTPAISLPSAPPITEAVIDDGPIHYPSIDSSPVDLKLPVVESRPGTSEAKEGPGVSSTCVICLDAPVEGACIPCGHMAGCMSCLNEIGKKKWGCPVCRANIDQVIKVYVV